jgi:hypothetical protein
MSTPYANLEGVTPLISDRFINTFVAGSAITMGQLLYLNGTDFTVAPTVGTANVTTVVGIALATRASGKTVPVVTMGLVRAKAYGSISAGDQVASASGGTAGVGLIQSDTGGAAKKDTSVIGLAIQAISSGATGIILLF